MKRTLLICGMVAAILGLVGSSAEADSLTISSSTPSCTSTAKNLTGLETDLEACFGLIDGTISQLYSRKTVGNSESGTFASVYDTIFNLSTDSGTILRTDTFISMLCTACYLIVKDTNNVSYLFDISNWDGTSNVAFDASKLLLAGVDISNIGIVGQARPIPEPATMLLLGTGLGFAALRRRRRRSAAAAHTDACPLESSPN